MNERPSTRGAERALVGLNSVSVMAAHELSIEAIHEYFLEKGGLVSNRDVVKHFKKLLTDPATKDEARIKFKKIINTLATTKIEGEEKFLVLKPKYAPDSAPLPPGSPCYDPRNSIGIPVSPSGSVQDYSYHSGLPSPSYSPSHHHTPPKFHPPSPHSTSSPRQPPPYRPPPPPPPTSSPNASTITFDNISICSSVSQEPTTPQAPPRRKSVEKAKEEAAKAKVNEEKYEEVQGEQGQESMPISVKERTQKFNRLASVDDELSPRPQKEKEKEKKQQDKGVDEDDGASVSSLDQKKCTEWLVTAAKGDYQELAKLAADEPRLVKLKDPFTTVLHWGAKHGNANIIKLFAGKHKADVNARTGYTPLHMAIQFNHKDVFNLLVDVYNANPDIRDFSGRKPLQYESTQTQAAHKDSYKIKSRKKLADKDLRFLRIGSLNVKVKKTTEAFSNFLGVGSGSTINPADNLSEKIHKSWGSVDNLSQENLMPAPKGYVGKKKSKKMDNSGANSIPGTPSEIPRPFSHRNSMQDSDSDSAAGFDSQWQH